jgi:amino acid adenylation domain-containing protein
MKEIKNLLFHLTELNIKLWLENGRLRYSAPKGTLTQELRDQLVKNKTDIIDFLSQADPSKHIFIQSDTPIQRVSRNQDLPLSFAQQRLWFLDQLENSKSTTYNMPPTVIKLNGTLNAETLELSLNTIIQRHEILRTHFTIKEDTPVQEISDQFILELKRIDLKKYNKDQQLKELNTIIRHEAEHLFDLSKGSLIRGVLITIDQTEHVIIISMHHIISDGWSTNIFVQELGQLYNAFISGNPSPLPTLTIQYADYAIWQRHKLTGEFLEEQKKYWKNKLADAPALLELPIDYPRPPVQKFRGKTEYFYLSKEFTNCLNQFSKKYSVTLFMSLFASFATLLFRYTDSEDIVIGTPVANRNHPQTENLIGFFVNTIVLRVNFQESLSFEDILQQVKKTALEAYDHQDIPFEQVVEELQVVRDLSYTPIFQVMFILLNTPFEEIKLTDLTINLLPTENINAVYELIMVMEESSNGIEGKVRYNTDVFKTSTIKKLIGHFTTLLKSIVDNARQTVLDLPLLTHKEIQQFQTWNKQPQTFPEDLCLHQLFETQVDQSPEAIALVFEDQYMTYQDLNRKANQIGHYLQNKGVKPDHLVGICLDRSIDMVIGILGILKAGAAYLPIDPTYPDERIAFTLKDATVDIVLSVSNYCDKFSMLQTQVVYLDQENFQSIKSENPDSNVSKHNLAYVIYTSGSTGKPKGVLITHDNVTRLFSATKAWYNFNHNDVWTLFHSYAFDFSVWEIWGALLYGGKLIIVPYWISRSPDAFYDLLCKHKVTVLNQTPSAFNQLQKVEEEQKGICNDLALRYVIFGGEALEFSSLKPWFDRHGDKKPQLINMYGITETTVHVTYHPLSLKDLDKSKSIIGYPIPDLQAYILDNNLNHKPVGISGELYIGGAGVASGYLNRPELTKKTIYSSSF